VLIFVCYINQSHLTSAVLLFTIPCYYFARRTHRSIVWELIPFFVALSQPGLNPIKHRAQVVWTANSN